jgi:putative solute:sodium symporter small subunit
MNVKEKKYKSYWRANLRYLSCILFIWFLVSFGFGIIFANSLNEFKLGGFPVGFWFAQQGSIYTFVLLIFIYVWLMNRLDKKYGFDN